MWRHLEERLLRCKPTNQIVKQNPRNQHANATIPKSVQIMTRPPSHWSLGLNLTAE
jgi:hypothetical protein